MGADMITINDDNTVDVDFGSGVACISPSIKMDELVFTMAGDSPLPKKTDGTTYTEEEIAEAGAIVRLRFPNLEFLNKHIGMLNHFRDKVIRNTNVRIGEFNNFA